MCEQTVVAMPARVWTPITLLPLQVTELQIKVGRRIYALWEVGDVAHVLCCAFLSGLVSISTYCEKMQAKSLRRTTSRPCGACL